METMVSEQFLNQKQLARRWGLSPRTLERWRCQGRGPDYLKLVGRVAYRLCDVEAFEATQFRACGSVSAIGTVRRVPALPGARLPAVTHRNAA
jgi:hypothetical protein